METCVHCNQLVTEEKKFFEVYLCKTCGKTVTHYLPNSGGVQRTCFHEINNQRIMVIMEKIYPENKKLKRPVIEYL